MGLQFPNTSHDKTRACEFLFKCELAKDYYGLSVALVVISGQIINTSANCVPFRFREA